MTEEQFKKIMIDYSEVDPNNPESVHRYGKRCMLAGMAWDALKGERDNINLGEED